MRRTLLILFVVLYVTDLLRAQDGSAQASSDLIRSYQQRNAMASSSLMRSYPVRNVGPTIQGGRIVDIDVNLRNPKEFYVGYASGGIFRTVNNGITFEPVFDHNDALGIGDFALSQSDPAILYVGTGEKNSSRSSYAGSGVYRTGDGGKSWTHCGLSESHHISRVLIHPGDNNTVWVAVIGSLYTNSPDRGVYKTTDGGKSWRKTLFVNDSTGVIDLVINPANPDQLFAASWERTRKAWHFKGNGAGSAIYRSDDGGQTWKISSNGFPTGKDVGRIGLDISPAKPNIIYAILDNQQEVEDKKEEKTGDKLRIEDFRTMSTETFLKLDDKKLDDFLKDNGFPKKYTAEIVKREVRENKYSPKAIGDYFGSDANANLFRTKIRGAELYRSEDSGQSWKKMNSYDLDGVFYTYGYYFAEMEVAPDNADLLYIYGVPLLKSRDGGATWHRIDTLEGVNDIHVDHHVLWVDPNDSRHLLLGNDGGLYQSYDEGANWMHINNMSVGQFYTVNVDMETPYNVYGGLQDNGVLKGSSKSIPNQTRHWEPIFGGDGMCAAPDPRNSKLVYTGFQFGNYYRLELDKGKTTKITPQHNIGETPLRWNWRTPLFLSKHNPDIVYTAANKVFRSMSRGENWEVISADLTTNRPPGNVPFSTISALAESPLKFGLLYAGTDDGNVWVSKDGGGQWTPISAGLPAKKWVSYISPSPDNDATVFIALNGYRDDDFKTYLFMSTDYGSTWTSVKGNLPESVANVVIQDPMQPSILYCGLDNGTYVSLDRGATWHLFNNMLNVPSYDMIVHPRENELVVATHGRSIFVADIKPLQSVAKAGANTGVIAYEPEPIRYSEKWGQREYEWARANEPKITILYYVGQPASAVNVEIYDEKNVLQRRLTGDGTRGFHQLTWDVRGLPPAPGKKAGTKAPAEPKYVAKGKYRVKFMNAASTSEVTVEIK
ncbi:MAG TPA: glycosyl hydrolase [Chryseosolibacter sp.]|nr:glycosyl hydrolase [Chryseosolibacter sp.]